MITARSAWYKSMDSDGEYVSLDRALNVINQLSEIGVFNVRLKNLTKYAENSLAELGFDVQTSDVETSITWYNPMDVEE